MAGMSEQNRDTMPTPRILRSSSAGNSFYPREGRNYRNNGADQQRRQMSELHFDRFPTPQTFACWKMRFKTEVFSCSHFLAEAMLWIRVVKLANSVDDLKSSRSTQGTNFPDCELLDARISSALKKLIQNSYFRKRVSLEELKARKQQPIPSRKTDCLLDLLSLPGLWRQRFCTCLGRLIHGCSSE